MTVVYLYRGDTPTLVFTLRDEDGNPVDLTNCTVYFAVEKDETVIINKTCAIINPAAGQLKVTLTSTETDFTGEALAELEGRYTDGTITTFGQFIIIMREDVRK